MRKLIKMCSLLLFFFEITLLDLISIVVFETRLHNDHADKFEVKFKNKTFKPMDQAKHFQKRFPQTRNLS